MLELVISITIISIIALAIPRLISESTKSFTVTLQQEAISSGMSHMIQILNRYWDEKNTQKQYSAEVLRIINPDS